MIVSGDIAGAVAPTPPREMFDAQNASSGFALRTYLDPEFAIKALAQRGPGEAPERLPAKAWRGWNRLTGSDRDMVS